MTISSKPHVVLVNIWRVVDAKGGTEKVFCEMANQLISRGYRVTAVCHDENQGKPGFELNDEVHFINTYKKPSIFDVEPIRSIRAFRFNKEKRRGKRYYISSFWKAQNIKQSMNLWDDADIVISYQPQTTYILKEILKINKPVITMFHLTPAKFISRQSYHFCGNAVSSSACIQVLVPEYVDIVKQAHPDTNIVCIPNEAPQYEEVSPLTEKRIVNVARALRQKRPDLLIEAFALLKDRYPDWKCEWYGENNLHQEYAGYLRNLIQKNNLEDRFLFMGPTNEIQQKLKSGSIFAFPSEYEGLSLALLEGMSAGLPVVGCLDCPSMKSMIQDNVNGFLVQPQPEEFAEALARLMDSFELRQRLGKQSKETSKKFSPDVIWQKWDALIRTLINQ